MKNTIIQKPAEPSLADKAYQLLTDQVISLQLQPGQLLVEKELVELTGIGRTPVREAIQRLAAAIAGCTNNSIGQRPGGVSTVGYAPR